MASISLGKLKTMLPFTGSPDGKRSGKAKGFLGSLEPEVCFQMTLVPNQTGRRESAGGDKAASSAAASAVPELHVKILSARHLPNIFGLKTVQGYVVKVSVLSIIKCAIMLTGMCFFRSNFSRVHCASIRAFRRRRGRPSTRRSSFPWSRPQSK